MTNLAQKRWKKAYRRFVAAPFKPMWQPELDEVITTSELMQRYRREAALERKLEAAQRTIEAHTMRVNGVIRIINDGADEWQHVFDDETESCKFCGYDWPCQYETMRRGLLGLEDENMVTCNVPHDKIEIAA